MASLEAMASAAGSAIVDVGGDVAEFLGMGDSVQEAEQIVANAAKVSATDPGLALGLSADDIAGLDAASPGITSSSGLGGLKDWSMKALDKVMPQIMASAMAPKPQAHAPLGGSGHGVQASTASYGQVVNEIGKAAGGDPLSGLTGFKNLL